MNSAKWILLAVALVAIAAFAVAIVVTQIERRQARYAEKLKLGGAKPVSGEAKVAIVYFSRSGNTGIAARHLASRLNGDVFEITAEDYELGISGWISSLSDARIHEASIVPETVDLSNYESIYLGAPIWLYSPAPPIWQFARSNRFDGKRVVLFNTFNSKFEQSYIDSFEEEVLQQGASQFEHLFVKRGRMGQQISPEEMIEKMDTDWELVSVGEPKSL